MINKRKNNSMRVEENQYRAVITKLGNGWSASVQKRIGIDEWERVRCGLKGEVFQTSNQAENAAKKKMKQQKNLDKNISHEVSYIIYGD